MPLCIHTSPGNKARGKDDIGDPMPDEVMLSSMAVDLGKDTVGLSSARNRLCTLGQLQTPEQGCAHLGSGIRIFLRTADIECVAQHGDTRKHPSVPALPKH